MDLKNSPLFHFIVGTLWFLAAAVTALEQQAFIGNIYWPPIILSIAGVYFYARFVYLIIKEHKRR